MSACGPKQTWVSALQMSAFGGKADKASKALHGRIKPSSFGGLLGVFEISRGMTFS
jgi:hypothetical protein